MDVAAFMARYEQILSTRGIPKMDFYKMCGFTDAAVSQWRRGKNTPSMKTIQTIADCLGVTAEYLLTGTEPKEKAPTPEDEREIGFDDFTYAFFNEMKDLPEEKKRMLLDMARFMRADIEKEKGK